MSSKGAGRFDGASGNGTSNGLTRITDQWSKITLDGMINYDASNRSNR